MRMPLIGSRGSKTTHWPTRRILRTALQSDTFLCYPLCFPCPSQLLAWHCGQRSIPSYPLPSPLSFIHISPQYISYLSHLNIFSWRVQSNTAAIVKEHADVAEDHHGQCGRRKIRNDEGGRECKQRQSRRPGPQGLAGVLKDLSCSGHLWRIFSSGECDLTFLKDHC